MFRQRFLSIIGIAIHRVCMILHKSPGCCCYIFLKKCPPVQDAALEISRKDAHSACIYRDFALGRHFCVTHLPAYCHQNAVQNRCALNLLDPLFNNKSECLTRWLVMYRFQTDTHYTACHHWYIWRQHNHNWDLLMSISLDLTSTLPHQIQLMMQ